MKAKNINLSIIDFKDVTWKFKIWFIIGIIRGKRLTTMQNKKV